MLTNENAEKKQIGFITTNSSALAVWLNNLALCDFFSLPRFSADFLINRIGNFKILSYSCKLVRSQTFKWFWLLIIIRIIRCLKITLFSEFDQRKLCSLESFQNRSSSSLTAGLWVCVFYFQYKKPAFPNKIYRQEVDHNRQSFLFRIETILKRNYNCAHKLRSLQTVYQLNIFVCLPIQNTCKCAYQIFIATNS